MKAVRFIFFIILMVIVSSCGSSGTTDTSSDTGSAIFSIKWPVQTEVENSTLKASVDCAAISVSTVSVNVYDESSTLLASGGPWDCTSGSGTINGIKAGSNRRFIVEGNDSSDNVIYRGEKTGVSVTAGTTTDCGTVTMSYVGVYPSAPANLSATSSDGTVLLSWDSVSGATGYKIYMATSSGVTSTSYSQANSTTSSSYTWTGLTNGTTYYFVVTTEDVFGEGTESSEVYAAPNADPPVTYLTDDFNDGTVSTQWTSDSSLIDGSSGVTLLETGGQLTITVPEPDANCDTHYLWSPELNIPGDFTVLYEFEKQGSGHSSLLLSSSGVLDGSVNDNILELYISTNDTPYVRVRTKESGSGSVLFETSNSGYLNVPLTFRIERIETQFYFYINDNQIGSSFSNSVLDNDTTITLSLATGTCTWKSGDGVDVIDSLTMTE